MKLKSFAAVALFLIITTNLSAQNLHNGGKIGIGIDNLTSSPNFLLKYYFTDKFSMNLITGLNYEALGEDAALGQTKVDGYDLRLGLAGMYHFNFNRVSPYLGVEAIYQIKKDAGYYSIEPDPKNNFSVGLIFGADYFLFDQFSLGIKQNFNFDFSLSRDIPKEETDVLINTKTELTARFYF